MSRGYDALRLFAVYGPVGAPKIIRRLLWRGGMVEFRNRGRTYVMPNELSARYHLLESIDKLRDLAAFVGPDDRVIVDVGAHAGLFAAFALEQAPEARLLCVEPDPHLAPVIARNLRMHSNWTLAQVAVTERAGDAEFHRAASSQESSLIRSMIRSTSEQVRVQTETLDALCKDFETIDVLKVDVQGAEHHVLAGAEKTIKRVRTLLIEVTLMDALAHEVLAELVAEFGPWRVVNPVYAGADLVFQRAN